MISKYKKVNIKNILLGIIIVVIIGGLGIALNTSKLQAKTPVNIAKEFGKNFYAVDSQKIADYKKMLKARDSMVLITSNGVTTTKANKTAEANYIKTMSSFDKNIQPLMIKEAYDGVVGNRWNTLSTEVCAEGNYTMQVTDFILTKDFYYGGKKNIAAYYYETKLKIISTNGDSIKIDMGRGYIGLSKENGKWKVSTFKITELPKIFYTFIKM